MVSTHVYFMDINLKLSQHETKKHAAFSGATQAWVSWQLRKMQTAVGLGKSCVQKPRLGKAWLELVICYRSVYCRNNRDRLHISNTATRTPTSAALLGKTHIGSLPKDTLKKEEATKSSLTVHFHKAHPPFIQEMKCWPTSSFHWACWGTRRVKELSPMAWPGQRALNLLAPLSHKIQFHCPKRWLCDLGGQKSWKGTRCRCVPATTLSELYQNCMKSFKKQQMPFLIFRL